MPEVFGRDVRRARRRLAAGAGFALFVLAAGCTPQFVTPAGPPPLRYRDQVFSSFTKTADITYGSAVNAEGDTVTLKLDTYAPNNDAVSHRPAIVWVHGGAFSSGTKASPELVDESQTFSRKGFVNASIDYRLEPQGCSASGPTTDCIRAIQEADEDALTAVRYLRSHASTYGIDPNRIAIGGSSAGAIVALNAAYSGNDDGTPANSETQAAVSLSGAHLFGTIDSHDPPAFLMHGTNDGLVPYQWAVNTINDAHAAGAAAYLTTWQGAGHVPYVEHHDEIHDQTTNFLYSALDLAHAAR